MVQNAASVSSGPNSNTNALSMKSTNTNTNPNPNPNPMVAISESASRNQNELDSSNEQKLQQQNLLQQQLYQHQQLLLQRHQQQINRQQMHEQWQQQYQIHLKQIQQETLHRQLSQLRQQNWNPQNNQQNQPTKPDPNYSQKIPSQAISAKALPLLLPPPLLTTRPQPQPPNLPHLASSSRLVPSTPQIPRSSSSLLSTKCPIPGCTNQLESLEKLRLHATQAHSKFVNAKYPRSTQYTQILRVPPIIGSFKCPRCGKTLRHAGAMVMHAKTCGEDSIANFETASKKVNGNSGSMSEINFANGAGSGAHYKNGIVGGINGYGKNHSSGDTVGSGNIQFGLTVARQREDEEGRTSVPTTASLKSGISASPPPLPVVNLDTNTQSVSLLPFLSVSPPPPSFDAQKTSIPSPIYENSVFEPISLNQEMPDSKSRPQKNQKLDIELKPGETSIMEVELSTPVLPFQKIIDSQEEKKQPFEVVERVENSIEIIRKMMKPPTIFDELEPETRRAILDGVKTFLEVVLVEKANQYIIRSDGDGDNDGTNYFVPESVRSDFLLWLFGELSRVEEQGMQGDIAASVAIVESVDETELDELLRKVQSVLDAAVAEDSEQLGLGLTLGARTELLTVLAEKIAVLRSVIATQTTQIGQLIARNMVLEQVAAKVAHLELALAATNNGANFNSNSNRPDANGDSSNAFSDDIAASNESSENTNTNASAAINTNTVVNTKLAVSSISESKQTPESTSTPGIQTARPIPPRAKASGMQLSFVCSAPGCAKSYASQTSLNGHNWQAHGDCIVKFSDGRRLKVTRDPTDKLLHCPCLKNHFKYNSGITKHALSCLGVPSATTTATGASEASPTSSATTHSVPQASAHASTSNNILSSNNSSEVPSTPVTPVTPATPHVSASTAEPVKNSANAPLSTQSTFSTPQRPTSAVQPYPFPPRTPAEITLKPYPTSPPLLLADSTPNTQNFRAWTEILAVQMPHIKIDATAKKRAEKFRREHSLDVKVRSNNSNANGGSGPGTGGRLPSSAIPESLVKEFLVVMGAPVRGSPAAIAAGFTPIAPAAVIATATTVVANLSNSASSSAHVSTPTIKIATSTAVNVSTDVATVDSTEISEIATPTVKRQVNDSYQENKRSKTIASPKFQNDGAASDTDVSVSDDEIVSSNGGGDGVGIGLSSGSGRRNHNEDNDDIDLNDYDEDEYNDDGDEGIEVDELEEGEK
ncbi:hypothetical protein HK100_010745 [Physocladia obscura]|uniref:C2H2-type domain-containing protein n=1 Tax=Physocladia obscura TaxID=109957 RepID=A0AAD5XHF1_9FUNG|nr:hypothetical protein HK100_010745 [Physocladia obscura]